MLPGEKQPDKLGLRATMLAARQQIDPVLRQQWDARICRQVLDWWLAHPVKQLGVYWPIRGEPDLRPVYAELARLGVRLALPVVCKLHAPLDFVAWTPGDALLSDSKGVPVPAAKQGGIVPDGLLIPCVGFDSEGFRLGYGGGFYDRTLGPTPRPLAIGIAYTILAVQFEHGPFDIALDAIITEVAQDPKTNTGY